MTTHHDPSIQFYQYPLALAPLSSTPSVHSNPPSIAIHCRWPRAFQPGQWLRLSIPKLTQELWAETRVINCRESGTGFQLTLAFTSEQQAFRFRMAEQLWLIQRYQHLLRRQGRRLSPNQAAQEWIQRFGDGFASAAAAL